MWNLEGSHVKGVYLGEFPYSGRVASSRVKYGGKVQHMVKLDRPIVVYGMDRTILLVDEDEEFTVVDTETV